MDLRTNLCRLAIVAASGVVVACGAQTLDGASVEEQVLAELQAAGSPVTAVSCPERVDVQAGGTFTCTGTTDEGEWTIEVTQTDDAGSLSFEVVGAS